MGLCHIAHNCELGNKIVMCNSSLLAGYVGVGDMVFMSGNCVVHQFVRIGRLVMVSGSARVGKDVPPFMITERESAIASYNAVGIKRAGLDVETRNEIKKAFTILYLSGLNIKSALEKMESQLNSPEIKHFVEFIRASKKRGVCNYSRRRT